MSDEAARSEDRFTPQSEPLYVALSDNAHGAASGRVIGWRWRNGRGVAVVLLDRTAEPWPGGPITEIDAGWPCRFVATIQEARQQVPVIADRQQAIIVRLADEYEQELTEAADWGPQAERDALALRERYGDDLPTYKDLSEALGWSAGKQRAARLAYAAMLPAPTDVGYVKWSPARIEMNGGGK